MTEKVLGPLSGSCEILITFFFFCYCCYQKSNFLASKMVEQVRVLVTKADNLSLNPGSHMAEGENQLPTLFSDLQMYPGARANTHTNMIFKKDIIFALICVS